MIRTGFSKVVVPSSGRLFSSNATPSQIVNKHLWRTAGYINGEFTNGSATEFFDVHNPANGSVIAKLPRMGAKDAETAAQASYDAWQVWKNTTVKERSKVLMKMANLMTHYQEDLATIITLEAGKPLAEARGEVMYAQSFYELYSEEAKRINGDVLPQSVHGRRMLAIRQPVGPAALITPWNFPSAMITRKVGPALAAGCSVAIKPAEETPMSALALCVIAEEAGLPAGIMNCLTVARSEVVDVGTAMCHSPLFRKLSFTGSTPVGKWLMRECATTVKRISLELGGNAPFIVFDDADIETSVTALVNSKFRNAGQTCISSNRVLVQEGVYDAFAAALAARVTAMQCGDGLTEGSTCGPLINDAAVAKVGRHVEDCVAKGATVLAGGAAPADLNEAGGCFFTPTVMANVTEEMLPCIEETFGPIAPLLKFKTEDEALRIANSTRMGLASYLCTRDLARSWRVSEALEFGMVGVNEGAISADTTPFGGIKESGIGREGGPYGLEEYLEVKYICMGGITSV